MNILSKVYLGMTVVLIVLAFGASECKGQVDPEWLKSWNGSVENRPENLVSENRIASKNEPGVPLVIHGQVFLPDGRTPAENVIVHAYHRDHAGYDFGPNDNTVATWRIQGWAITDNEGRFEFRTIRPAADHIGREGPHIHFTLVSDDFGRQWTPKVWFGDDSLVSERQLLKSEKAGKFGSVREVKTIEEVQYIDVNFRLKQETDF